MMHRQTFVALIAAYSTSVAFAQPRPGETWYVLKDGDTHYGFVHTTVRALPDGDFAYDTDSRVLLNVFGVEKQEILQTSRAVVSPTYRLRSIVSTTQLATGPIRVEGTVANDTLQLVEHRRETRNERTLALPVEAVPDLCLHDWLRDQAPASPPLRVTIVETTEFQLRPLTLERSNPSGVPGARWTLTTDDGSRRGVIQFDAAGDVAEVKNELPAVHMVRAGPEAAQGLTHRTMSGRELLTFPVDRDLPPADTLRELVVKLTWRDIPLEDFELRGWNQQLVEHHEKDGVHTAVVRLLHRTPSSGDASTAPASQPEMDRWLATTEFLKPEDDAIRKLAREVAGDETHPLAKVRALSAWCTKNIETRMIAETLTGPEVLDRKVGKCSEFATLFGSLARAAGIPTRIALGERLIAGQWGGHMWNEVYVGEWIPVDAGANEIGGGCLLLKFIHSDTVGATQPLRWALTRSLDIHVVSFERTESPVAAGHTTGVVDGVYTNTDYNCRLTCPEPGWKLTPKDSRGSAIVRIEIPGHDDALVHFVAFPIPEGMPPETLVTARMNVFRSQYSNFAITSDTPRKVGGCAGRAVRFDRDGIAEHEPGPMRTTEFIWVSGPRGYLLNLIAPTAEHDALVGRVEALLGKFELLAPASGE